MGHGVPISGVQNYLHFILKNEKGFEFKKFKLPLNPRSTGIVVR